MKKKYKNCQSCGMPLKKEADHGTNKDGSYNEKYCHNCYQKGEFTEPKITLEAMKIKVRKIMKEKMPVINLMFGKTFVNKIQKLERWTVSKLNLDKHHHVPEDNASQNQAKK